MQNKSIFSGILQKKSSISKRVFQFSLGALFMISGGTFAAVNSGISLPPVGSAGDIITVEYWNQVVNGTRELDQRTQEINSEDGNVVIGGFNTEDTSNYTPPVEQLDVRGAVKIGTTTSTNAGTIRFNSTTVDGAEVHDFEGYTGEEWKSLTKGDGTGGSTESGEACTAVESSTDFITETEDQDSGIIQASCENGSISYASVEWGSNPGELTSSLALTTNQSNITASMNTLGNPAKIHLICCAGGAGSGGANDELAQLKCSEGNVPKWSTGLNKWACAEDLGGVSPWSQILSNTYIEEGNVGIGTSDPQATLDVAGDIKMNTEKVATEEWVNENDTNTQLSEAEVDSYIANNGYLTSFTESDPIFTNSTINTSITALENGNVGIGTDNPEKLLHLKTEAGTNAEINIQTGEKSKWALYHDEESEELRFWNSSDIFSLSKTGDVTFSGKITGSTPLSDELTNFTTVEYVNNRVEAAGDWQKGKICTSGNIFSGYDDDGNIKCLAFPEAVLAEKIFGKTCGDETLFAGYEENGDIKCIEISGVLVAQQESSAASSSNSTTNEEKNIISFEAGDAATDGNGSYFSVGGAPSFCKQMGISGEGIVTGTNINNSLQCGTNTTNDKKLYCQDGGCVGGRVACTVPNGTGFEDKISFGGKEWIACTDLTCNDIDLRRHHKAEDGSHPNDECKTFLSYSVSFNEGILDGYAYNPTAGYFSMKGDNYAVVVPPEGGQVTGYAYNPSIGYLHFCDTVNNTYCVDYNAESKEFSGYAYSPSAGYIKLNDESKTQYGVYLNTEKNRLQGSAYSASLGYLRFTQESPAPEDTLY